MAWLSSFLLGRPGQEVSFDVNPEAMEIEETGISVLQRNLAGDLKKSTLKVSAPTIKINSSYLTLAQRNQFASLVGVSDTFLSFQTRDDWQSTYELVTVLSTNTFKLQNSSAFRLSQALVRLGYPSIITINGIFLSAASGEAYGEGPYGAGPYGGSAFATGAITYDDLTGIITIANPIPDITAAAYVTYTYTGWLVNLERLGHKAQGGWLDRFTYDFQLTGA